MVQLVAATMGERTLGRKVAEAEGPARRHDLCGRGSIGRPARTTKGASRQRSDGILSFAASRSSLRGLLVA